MKNILTIDVEDYFQVENFRKVIKFSDWEKYESRVVRNTERILKILDSSNAEATFFVLGWIGEKFPELVKKIHESGHEISCHGYGHKLIYGQSQEEFRTDLIKAKAILEGIIREPVLGYRAPSFSINKKSLWALDILAEEGFKYDSSIFPAYRDRGGLIKAERHPHEMHNGGNSIWEFPVSTVRMLNQNFPFSGGGYFRLFPYCFTKWAINRINNEGHPVNVYIHPWELDAKQPRIKADHIGTFRHYVNISKTEKKLKKLLRDFKFTAIRNVLEIGDEIGDRYYFPQKKKYGKIVSVPNFPLDPTP